MNTYLNKTENASDPKNSDYPEKCRADREISKHILQEDAHDRCKHKNEVKEIPWHCEVMMAQTNDLDYCLCVI